MQEYLNEIGRAAVILTAAGASFTIGTYTLRYLFPPKIPIPSDYFSEHGTLDTIDYKLGIIGKIINQQKLTPEEQFFYTQIIPP